MVCRPLPFFFFYKVLDSVIRLLPFRNKFTSLLFSLTNSISTYCITRMFFIYFFLGNLITLPIGCFYVDKNTSFLRRWRFITTAWAAPNRGNYRESLLIIVVLCRRRLFLWRRRIGWSVGRTKCQMLAGECVRLPLAVSLHVLLDQKCSPFLNQAVLVTTKPLTMKTEEKLWLQRCIFLPLFPC